MFKRADDGDRQSLSASELLARAGLSGVPRGAVAGVLVVVALVVVAVGWRLGGAVAGGEFSFESHEAGSPPAGGMTAPDGDDSEERASGVWVHVVGAVHSPGLYELPSGSRAGDAILAAGGAAPDARLDAVNLARLLTDGEQVYVPDASSEAAPSGQAAAPGGKTGAGAVAGEGVDINRASAAELEALPGVGPATAQKIVDDREANGPFTSPEDLMRVSGIGEKKFAAMRDLVVVR